MALFFNIFFAVRFGWLRLHWGLLLCCFESPWPHAQICRSPWPDIIGQCVSHDGFLLLDWTAVRDPSNSTRIPKSSNRFYELLNIYLVASYISKFRMYGAKCWPFYVFGLQQPSFFHLPCRNHELVVNMCQSPRPDKFRTIHFSYTVSMYRSYISIE